MCALQITDLDGSTYQTRQANAANKCLGVVRTNRTSSSKLFVKTLK
jgi:hypothetical protein